MTSEPFRVRVTVRGYELDTQGHLNQAVYLQYAEHARWEAMRAAGVGQAELIASGVGPVVLETTVRYLRELRGGDEVDVSCAFDYAPGRKTFRLVQHIVRDDGTAAAELTAVGGLLDLHTPPAGRRPAGPAAQARHRPGPARPGLSRARDVRCPFAGPAVASA